MSLASTIARARAFQESLFSSECTITRSGGEPTFNPSTGEYTPATPIEIYEGPCNVRPYTSATRGSERQVGEQEVTFLAYEGKLPVDTAVRKNDVLTVDSSTWDANLVGKKFRITDVPNDDWQIARVVLLEEVT